MVMEFAIGVAVVAMAIPLVYGMKKGINLIHYKRDNDISWKAAKQQFITKWYDWPSIILFLVVAIMLLVGIFAG